LSKRAPRCRISGDDAVSSCKGGGWSAPADGAPFETQHEKELPTQCRRSPRSFWYADGGRGEPRPFYAATFPRLARRPASRRDCRSDLAELAGRGARSRSSGVRAVRPGSLTAYERGPLDPFNHAVL
jgi:hypothetical protein